MISRLLIPTLRKRKLSQGERKVALKTQHAKCNDIIAENRQRTPGCAEFLFIHSGNKHPPFPTRVAPETGEWGNDSAHAFKGLSLGGEQG